MFSSQFKELQANKKIANNDHIEDIVDLKWNKLRVHYFSENYDIYKFISDTTVELRLTKGKNWNDTIATWKLELLLINKDFKNDPFFEFDKNTALIVQMETVNVFMYCPSSDIKQFYLKTKTGFKFDQEIQTEKLDLWKYNSVFFPENWYFNSNALPIEWLEIFEKKEELVKIE